MFSRETEKRKERRAIERRGRGEAEPGRGEELRREEELERGDFILQGKGGTSLL